MMWFHKQVMIKKKSADGVLSYLFLIFVLLLCTPTTIDCSSSMDQEYRRCRELKSNTNRKYYSSGVVMDDTTTTNGGGEGASRRNHTSQRVRQQRQGTIPIVPSLQGFYDSTCEVCPMNDDGTYKITATEPIAINFDINQTKVVILALSPSSSFEKTMIVAAGLLSSQAHVTIITGPHMPDTLLIRQVLFQHIPCRHHLMASMLLDFQQLNIDTNQLPCPSLISSMMMMQLQQQQHQHNNYQSMGGASLPPELQKSTGDILLCNIQNSEILVTAIRNVLNRILTKPTLFLMDATCMAGIVVAEQLHIPAVLMIEEADVFLQHILGTPKLSILSSSTTGIVIPSILNSKSSTTSIPSSTTTTHTDTSSTIITVIEDTIWNLIHYWNPRSLYHTISIGIQDRLNSLDLTSSFMAFNRIRAKYKLQRIRHVVDMWKVGGCVLLANSHTTIIKHDQIKTTVGSDSDTYYDYVIVERIIDNDDTNNNNYGRDDGTGWSTAFPNLYTIPDPLLPPCISCTNEPITTRRDTATRMKRTMTTMENKSKQKHRKTDTGRKSTATGSQSSSTDIDDSDGDDDDDTSIPRIVLSVAFRNDEKGRSGSRRLMLGFWLAKQSIQQLSKSPCNTTTSYDDDNQTRSTTATADLALAAPFSTSTCWNGPTDFRLVRPGSMPEVLPPGNDNVNDDFLATTNNNFVTAEETSYLDTLARHQPIAMVSVCDSSNTWTQSLGPPVICLDTSWPARKIAFSIVSLLRNINSTYTRPTDYEQQFRQNEQNSNATTQGANQHRLQNVDENLNSTSSEPTTSTTNGLDGLEWIVSLMDRLSSLHDEKNHVWQSGRQMFHDVLLELEMMTGGDGSGEPRQEERQSHETIPHLITVYLAWIILMASILYLPLKHPMIKLRCQLNRRLHHQRHNNSNSNHASNATTNNRYAGSKNNGDSVDHDLLDDHDLRFSSIGTEIYYRLPDLDLAWNMWTSWVRDTVQWMRVTIDEGWQQPFHGDNDELEEDKRQHLKKNGSRKHSLTTSTPINGFSHHNQQLRPGVAKSSFAISDEVLVNGSNGSTMRKRRTAKKRH